MRNRDSWDGPDGLEVPGQVHRTYRTSRRRKRPCPDLRLLIALVCALVGVVALVQLIGWGWNALSTWQTNRELRALREEAAQMTSAVTQAPFMTPCAQPESTAVPGQATAPQRTPVQLVTVTPLPQEKIFHQLAGEMLPDMQALYQKNRDLVGWLSIPGVVDLPVVYRDNSYYLYRDFNGKESKSGTLFLDEHHPLKSTTQHLVIHGHNMTDGSMFGLLPHYRSKSYVLEHGIVIFSTLYEQETYAVVAVAMTPEDMSRPGAIPYIGLPAFDSDAAFNYYMDKVRAGALYQVYLDVQPTDALLTLSTCLGDDRLLLVCRRLRADETVEGVRRIQRLSIQ